MKYTKLYHEIVTFKQDVGHKVGRDSGFRKKGGGWGWREQGTGPNISQVVGGVQCGVLKAFHLGFEGGRGLGLFEPLHLCYVRWLEALNKRSI